MRNGTTSNLSVSGQRVRTSGPSGSPRPRRCRWGPTIDTDGARWRRRSLSRPASTRLPMSTARRSMPRVDLEQRFLKSEDEPAHQEQADHDERSRPASQLRSRPETCFVLVVSEIAGSSRSHGCGPTTASATASIALEIGWSGPPLRTIASGRAPPCRGPDAFARYNAWSARFIKAVIAQPRDRRAGIRREPHLGRAG